MTSALVSAAVETPHVDYAALSPYIALAAGAMVVLLAGIFARRPAGPTALLSLVTLGVAAGLSIWRIGDPSDVLAGALRVDDFALVLSLAILGTGLGAVLLSWRARDATSGGHAEYYSLLLLAVLGMVTLVAAQNLVTLFVAFELLSIPLYAMCAAELRRERSLESGLKYLVVGSLGSATLLYGLTLVYGATGSTDFGGIADALADRELAGNVLLLSGVALSLVGLAFKASVAPFHQWTPDVYEGAPTVVTAFMAVATKVAAFGVLLRLFDVALVNAQIEWQPAIAALATVTIVVGNVGALTQRSLKRLLAWSGVAQAGYLLCGVVVATQLGVRATVFYLVVYLAMNLAAFAVVVARERATDAGDDIAAVAGIGRTDPLLAWPMTVAMLALAGIPATAGFIGKFVLIDALVDGGYTWLGIVLVVGSMISLGYYLRVVAAVWMGDPEPSVAAVARPAGAPPVMAGGSQEADAELGARRVQPEVLVVAWLSTAAALVFGIVPAPLLQLAERAAASFTGIF